MFSRRSVSASALALSCLALVSCDAGSAIPDALTGGAADTETARAGGRSGR